MRWNRERLIIALLVIMVALALLVRSIQVNAQQPSDKYDGDCSASATQGRCADKCPDGDFVRGYDKETGAVVCGHVTGCPYGDSIPLDSPKCVPPPAASITPEVSTNPTEAWGK